ncbi:MAG: class D sortase [Terriglobales bacterium]
MQNETGKAGNQESIIATQKLRGDPKQLRPGAIVGRISIPRLRISSMVAEGVDDFILRHAVGHLPGTPTPNANGTVVLAAHRDTFFRSLGNIQTNDLIQLDTADGKYQYKVTRTEVIDPHQVEVLQSSPDSDLTLVTCFPFHYIGPAPKRFIVQALRLPSS